MFIFFQKINRASQTEQTARESFCNIFHAHVGALQEQQVHELSAQQTYLFIYNFSFRNSSSLFWCFGACACVCAVVCVCAASRVHGWHVASTVNTDANRKMIEWFCALSFSHRIPYHAFIPYLLYNDWPLLLFAFLKCKDHISEFPPFSFKWHICCLIQPIKRWHDGVRVAVCRCAKLNKFCRDNVLIQMKRSWK